MKEILHGIIRYYSFCEGKYELRRRHACGSCGLDDDEWSEVENFNRGVASAVPIMEEMEKYILELEEYKWKYEGLAK